MGLLLAIILSFGPALIYAWIVYTMDRYEKEPRLLLGGVFVWGAIVAVIGAIVGSLLFEAGIYAVTQSEALVDLAGGSLVAPIVEEIYKGLAVLLVYLVFRHEFDSVLDGIIYASITALGFAATENVLYLYNAGYAESGMQGLIVLFLLRVVLGGWNHAVYTAFTGIGLAVSRLSHNGFVRLVAPAAGLLLAIISHSVHNSIIALSVAAAGEDAAGPALVLTLLVDWLGWAFIFAIMIWAIRREHRWIGIYLHEEVERGLISAQQLATAGSSWARFGARMRALGNGRYLLTQRFYQLCSELAQKKHQLATVGDERGNALIIEQLRGELARLAPQAIA